MLSAAAVLGLPSSQSDRAAAASLADTQGVEVWMLVFEPTQTYWPSMEPAWTALHGEWYRVVKQEDNWALAYWEGDSPEFAVWIELTEAVALQTFPAARTVPVAPYRAASPEYGMNVFIWDQPRTTNRDLGKVA